MKPDYIIRGGRVIDPATNTDEVRDVVIKGAYIVSPGTEPAGNGRIIDAEGCIVAPGLIDYHTHIFHEGSSLCINPDFMIAQGTTAAVDAGTPGTVTYEAFYKTVVAQSAMRIQGYITPWAGGQLDFKLCEDFNPDLYNVDKLERVIDKYRDCIPGLKGRFSTGIVPDDKATDYLKRMVELAEKLNDRLGTALRVCIHTTNAPMTASELAGCLRPGDIFCHCYQGAGHTIIEDDGEIAAGILEARKRGIIFDSANGRGNFGVDCARRALAKGFLPDIISSDLTVDKFNMPPYAKNLPTVMSKYLALGLDLMTVLRATTVTPAKLMGMEGKIGTLAPGAYADVVIIREKTQRVIHKDFRDEELEGNVLLVPQMTILAGEIQYCQTDFFL